MTDKRKSVCKSQRMKHLARVGDFDSHAENGTGRGQRDGQCQTAETCDGHLRSGKPLKDSKQKSDRTSFTRPVISPGPHYFCFLCSGQPTLLGRVGEPWWPSPVLSHAVQFHWLSFYNSIVNPQLHSPCNPSPFLRWSSQPHYLPSSSLQIRYW